MLRQVGRVDIALIGFSVVAIALGWMAGAAAGALPDGRAYEMVSPPEKRGDVISDSQRTRASEDGSAVEFMTLSPFGDPQGTGVAAEYISERSSQARPESNGWTSHGISPLQAPVSFTALFGSLEPRYEGEFSADLNAGIFFAWSPLTADPNVAKTVNLYRRGNLRTGGVGAYQLVTLCPLCEAVSSPLPPPVRTSIDRMRPYLAWSSSDLNHVIFESRVNLTSDAPAYPASCKPTAMNVTCRSRVYEWDRGVLRLAGILPDGSAADVSLAGQGGGGRGRTSRNPHTVSDGSDGHGRVFFTQPTDADGLTSSEVPQPDQAVNNEASGKLFMRVDHMSTEQLNLSERSLPDAFSPARFLDASPDGRRAFFVTSQALTNDAPGDGAAKLYMYDASKPGTAPDNLTFMTPDNELGGGTDDAGAVGLLGTSADGRIVYMIVEGQLISDEPLLGTRPGIYMWRDGQLSFIGPAPRGIAQLEVLSSGTDYVLSRNQARVTPDGEHLLFSTDDGEGLGFYDHDGRRELYVYSGDTDTLVCASCNPTGAAATTSATVAIRQNAGGTQPGWHLNHAISDDGSRVFFSTAEALLPDDVNGKSDAYQYDVGTGALHLLSTGTAPSDSYFLDASANGRDAFIATRERLVGWDVDSAYDLYDARIGGGFPEPPLASPPCSGDSCQGSSGAGPAAGAVGSGLVNGTGNARARLKPRAKRCKKGFKQRTVRGKRRCVKKRRPPKRVKHARIERRGS